MARNFPRVRASRKPDFLERAQLLPNKQEINWENIFYCFGNLVVPILDSKSRPPMFVNMKKIWILEGFKAGTLKLNWSRISSGFLTSESRKRLFDLLIISFEKRICKKVATLKLAGIKLRLPEIFRTAVFSCDNEIDNAPNKYFKFARKYRLEKEIFSGLIRFHRRVTNIRWKMSK